MYGFSYEGVKDDKCDAQRDPTDSAFVCAFFLVFLIMGDLLCFALHRPLSKEQGEGPVCECSKCGRMPAAAL